MTRSLSTIQSAIATWVETSTGLPTFWANQDYTRPQEAYVLINSTVSPMARPWIDGSVNPSPSAGAEAVYTARTVERLTLTIQIFNTSTLGVGSASDLLSDLALASQLPTRAEALCTAGWSPAAFSDVTDISAPSGAAYFEPRTLMTCFGHTAPEASETGTIVSAVEITDSEGVIDYVGTSPRMQAQADIVARAELTAMIALQTIHQGTAEVDAAAFVTATVTAALQAEADVSAQALVTAACVAALVASGAMLATATLVGDASLVAGGPSILFESDYRTPATWGIGGNGTCASAFATDEWLLQETSGTYANNVGSETLANTSGLQGQEAIGLFDGTDYVSRKAWEARVGNQYLTASGTTAGDGDSEDISARIVFRVNQSPVGDYLLCKHAASGPGFRCLFNSSNLQVGIYDNGGNSFTLNAPVGVEEDGSWNVLTFYYDFSADMLYVKTKFGETSGSAAALTGSMSNALALRINSLLGSTRGLQKVQVTYAGVSVGANAQNFYDETVVLPGSTPVAATVLTTQSRASTISGQVSANRVCHFSGGVSAAAGCQLPIVWHEHLEAGTGGFGILSNSARTNLNPYSENITVWTHANMSSIINDGDAPDGFRSASSITALANNATVRRNSLPVATSTEYTASFWVKRNGGSDVSGLIRIYDDIGATFYDQAFTATSEWTLVFVTMTTDSSATVIRQYCQLDTSGESIFLWGAQTNLGPKRGAYIRTDGAAASFVKSNYEVTFAAGLFIDSTKGEAEVIWVTENPGAGNAYLFDAWTSGNIDRILCYNATDGTRPTGTGYDGSSVSQWTVRKAAVSDMTTQENTFTLQWDETGSLSVAPGAEASAIYNGSVDETDIGSYTTSNLIDKIAIGQSRADGDQPDAIISRLRIWDGER